MILGESALKQRAVFFRELATLVESGIPIGQALSSLIPRISAVGLRMAVRDAAGKVSGGKRFSEVMRNYPSEFSPLTLAMIDAGERGGRLDTMLQRLASYTERDVELRAMLARETFYPKILLCAVLFIPLAAPVVITYLNEGFGQALLVLLKAILTYAIVLGVPVLVCRTLINTYGRTQQGRYAIDSFKLHVPVFGKLIHRIAMSRFSRALSALYDAGVPVTQSLQLAGEATANAKLQATVAAAGPAVERGGKLSEALIAAGLVDDLALRMLQTGEDSGNIDTMMDKVAEHYERESETAIKQLSLLIVPLAVILAGIAVLLILVKAYMTYAGGIVGN